MTVSARYQVTHFSKPVSIRYKKKSAIWRKLAIEVRQAIGRFDEFDQAFSSAPAYRIKQVSDGHIDMPDKDTQEAIIRLVWTARRLDRENN